MSTTFVEQRKTPERRKVRRSHRSRRRSRRLSKIGKMVRNLSILNLVAVVALLVLLFIVSERWWFSSILTYLPRVPYLCPSILLLGCAFRWHRKSLWLNAIAILLVVGPIAGLRVSNIYSAVPVVETDQELRILSCNVQGFQPDFSAVLQEISILNPDVVAFQEADTLHALVGTYFREWHSVHVGDYWVGSKYPLRLLDECQSKVFQRSMAIKVEIEALDKKIVLTNVHLMTARRGLNELSLKNIITGTGPDRLEHHLLIRDEEAGITRDFVSNTDRSIPAVVVGDFNFPVSSSIYQDHWGDFSNAFDVAGSGYGFTSPCAEHRFWFDRTPWLRIDHILISPHWEVVNCRVGTQNGSDHRLIFSTVQLRQ